MIKNWKLFTQSLNEVVKNQELVKGYMEDIKSEILDRLQSNTARIYFNEPSGPIQALSLSVIRLQQSDLQIVETILLKWKKKLEEQSIMLSFEKNDSAPSANEIQVDVYLKDIKIKRVTPQRFILHFSKGDPKSILAKGLLPSDSSSSKSWHSSALSYPAAVFAVNSFNPYKAWSGKAFLIDTEGLGNEWWYDLNFPVGEVAIMTFDKVPSSNIVMLDRGDTSKIWKLENSGISKDMLNKEIEKIFLSRKGFIYTPPTD
jgi:hypothetical protein